ncbi:CdaR family protein [soil metagenome]
MGHRLRRVVSAATFVRLAVSIALAMIIWGFIVWETNPEISREFTNIAVTAENIPANMLIVGGLPSVSVTVRGPQDVVQDILPSDVTASVDLSEAESLGIDEYQVQVDVPSGVRRVIVEPAVIEAELDLIVAETFPITLREDQPRPASVTSIEASAQLASVQGPKALVDLVSTIELPVDLQGRGESFTEDVPLVPMSETGTPVEGVEVSPSTVELSVTFESTAKDVPVIVVCACIVDDRLEQITLTTSAVIPSTIRLSGPSSALAEISVVQTVPVDISELSESGWILDVELDTTPIPATVSLSDETVDVWVPITPTRLELLDIPVAILGLNPNLEVDLSTETVTVIVTGSSDVLEDPESLEIMALVDLTDFSAGSYTLEVAVVVPPGVTYEQVSPGTVRAVIRTSSSTATRLRNFNDPPTGGIR